MNDIDALIDIITEIVGTRSYSQEFVVSVLEGRGIGRIEQEFYLDGWESGAGWAFGNVLSTLRTLKAGGYDFEK